MKQLGQHCHRAGLLRKIGGVCLVVALGFFMHRAHAADTSGVCTHMVASGNPEFPPYLWRDPNDATRLIGANADFIQLLAKELGITIETKYIGPWGRVQEETKLGHEDLIVGVFLTLPRLDYMDYVYPPFRITPSVIWTRDTAHLNYKTWSDLRGLVGVTVIHNSFGEDFDSYAKASLKIVTVPSLEQGIENATDVACQLFDL